MPPVLIFANPISGRGRAKNIAQRLEHRLATEGYGVQLFLEPADRITRGQIDVDAAAAIVIGGDGTVRAVAGRFFREASGFGVRGSGNKPDAEAVGDAPGPPLNPPL